MNLSLRFLPVLAVVVVPVSPVFLHAQPPTSAAPARQGSAVFKWEDLKVVTKASGEQRAVTNLPTPTLVRFESHLTTLKPGFESHAPHHHPQEEVIVLKEGTLEVNINGHKQRVGAGSSWLFASHDVHNMKNVGDTPATYFVFNFTTAATASVPNKPAAEVAAPGKLPSSVWDWEKLVAKPTAQGARREVVSSPTTTMVKFDCHVTTLNPGQSPHAAHRHPDEEFIAIQEGLMEATINGVSQRAGPGSIFFFASNDLHGMKNVGTTPATYYVFRIMTEATPKETVAAN